jgi:metal-sulfur cluster biosynthetic enzyme
MSDRELIQRTLDTIIDPCSAAAGAPVGIVSMGLLRELSIRSGPDGASVRVTLGLTEPTCLMGYAFVPQARALLRALPGVAAVEVRLAPNAGWSEADMDPAYRALLAERRARRQSIRLEPAGKDAPR